MFQEFRRRDALRHLAALALLGPRLARAAVADDGEGVPEQIVDVMNAMFGEHPGFRAFHAKGVVCEGEFRPSPSAASLSKAAHLQAEPSKVTVRFSDGTGLPDVPDGFPDASPHGLAVKFHLPGGGTTDIVANAFNGFPVSDGEEFLAFFRAVAASKPGTPKPTPLDRFLEAHPKTAEVVAARKPTPASFATSPYFGVQAFEFTNADGASRFGRYRFRPEAGPEWLDVEEAARKPPDFLIDELGERLAGGPARFRLVVQLAAEGDATDDSMDVWPDDRPTVELGILSIDRKVADSDAAQRALAFDPMRLTEGIDPSDDPLLELRSAAYAVSRRRRQGGGR